MIDKILKNEKELDYAIIPKLKQWDEISLSHGDTLIVFWDFDKYDMDEAQTIVKMLERFFSKNQILIIPKGTELGVIKNEI